MRRALVILIALLLVLGAMGALGFAFITSKARANLSSAGFDREYAHTPESLGLAYENVTVASGDLRLAGWWFPANESASPERANVTVILVHGLDSNMGYASNRWARNLHEAGFSVLAIDLRNHGASDDGPDGYVTYGAAEADDVLAAIGSVRERAAELRVDPDRIALFGASMGAATVLRAASLHPAGLAAVIADSGYASLRFQARIDGAEQGYPQLAADLVVWRMRQLAPADPDLAAATDTIRLVEVPLLLTHCANDTRIQVASFDLLAPLAPAGTRTWREKCPSDGPDDDNHVSGWKMPAFNATVVEFLDAAAATP